jgi:hypothetical protein
VTQTGNDDGIETERTELVAVPSKAPLTWRGPQARRSLRSWRLAVPLMEHPESKMIRDCGCRLFIVAVQMIILA